MQGFIFFRDCLVVSFGIIKVAEFFGGTFTMDGILLNLIKKFQFGSFWIQQFGILSRSGRQKKFMCSGLRFIWRRSVRGCCGGICKTVGFIWINKVFVVFSVLFFCIELRQIEVVIGWEFRGIVQENFIVVCFYDDVFWLDCGEKVGV